MRILFIICIVLTFSGLVISQEDTNNFYGEVSYVTSKNIYVKFNSTSSLSIGDTLFRDISDIAIPALEIINKSSISCICKSLVKEKFEPGTPIFYTIKKEGSKIVEVSEKIDESTNPEDSKVAEKSLPTFVTHTVEKHKDKVEQSIYGRITASAYTTISGQDEINDPRLRYTLSLRAKNISGSRIHLESYVSFRHQINQWKEVSKDFNRAFKLYNLSLSYVTENLDFSIGRRINRSISNIGAVDGLQFSYRNKNLTYGAILGTRPDTYDCGFNSELPELGFYIEHQFTGKNGIARSTGGFFEQRNQTQTDRRFVYFQHSNSLSKKLFFFGSFELDLFKKINETAQNDLRLTSLYLSARYRFSRKYSMFISYDNRSNIIYYESYKSAIDRLIEQETRQGFRIRLVARPFRFGSLGLSGTYRYQKNNLSPTKNFNTYFNYSRLPFIKASISISYTYLDTYYLNSHISGVRMRKNLLKGRLGIGAHYRWVNYIYDSSNTSFQQHITGVDFNYVLVKDLSLSLNFESSFNVDNNYHRAYVKLIKRIR